MQIIKINGIYSGMGKITFDSMNMVDLKVVTQENIPELLMDFRLELTISDRQKRISLRYRWYSLGYLSFKTSRNYSKCLGSSAD